jgi:predicted Zn-dependent peptidase
MRELYPNCYAEQLENGVRVLVEPMEDRPLALGVWVRVGSRDEPAHQGGHSPLHRAHGLQGDHQQNGVSDL